MSSDPKAPKRAIVLSGGGARGAYEAGVLAYIHRELPQATRPETRAKLLCGTSVGAIHACFLASAAQLPNNHIDTLLRVWRNLELESLLRLTIRDLARLPQELRGLFRGAPHDDGLLIDVPRLTDVVIRDIAWPQIGRNMDAGLIDALTVSTTHIASGKTVVFIDQKGGGVPPWTRDARRIARAARVGPLHAVASAAIPMLFPPVFINGGYYCDGGLRQNTPISPALRLGADRALVVAVGHGQAAAAKSAVPQGEPAEAAPGTASILGKVANALLLDHLDYDLAQLHGFNRLLADGQNAFGDTFIEKLSASTETFRGAGYRKVDTVVIRPSEDLGLVAAQWLQGKRHQLGSVSRYVLSQLAADAAEGRSDLLSYIAFDGSLAAQFITLGMRDADAARKDLIAFYQD